MPRPRLRLAGRGGEAAPDASALLPPLPNPARGAVRVGWARPAAAAVHVEVLDLLGGRIALLADGLAPARPRDASWNAARVAPGVFLTRLRVGAEIRTARVTVVR